MNFLRNNLFLFLLSLSIVSCGGGGNGESSELPVLQGMKASNDTVGYPSNINIEYTGGKGDYRVITAITDGPQDSSLLGYKTTSSNFQITADVAGVYEFTVLLINDKKQSEHILHWWYYNETPVIKMDFEGDEFPLQRYSNPPVYSNPFTSLTFDASQSYDVDEHQLTFQWSVISKTDGSELTEFSSNQKVLTFLPENAGGYQITLRIEDGYGEHDIVRIHVNVSGFAYADIPFEISDAIYDESRDQALLLDTTNKLYLYNLVNQQFKTISLPDVGTVITLSTNYDKAFIGHNKLLSVVDLNTFELEKSYPLLNNIRTINYIDDNSLFLTGSDATLLSLDSGEEFYSSIIFNGKQLLHSANQYFYSNDGRISTLENNVMTQVSKIEPNGINSSILSMYQGKTSCNLLRYSKLHQFLYSACGHVVQISDDEGLEFTQSESLNIISSTKDLLVGSAAYLFLDRYQTEVLWNGDLTDIQASPVSQPLPFYETGLNNTQTHGQRLFYRNDGSAMAIVSSNTNGFYSGVNSVNGIAYIPSQITPKEKLPVANISSINEAIVGKNFELDGMQSISLEGKELHFLWQLDSIPETSNLQLSQPTNSQLSVIFDVPGRYVFSLVVSDAIGASLPATVSVDVRVDKTSKIVTLSRAFESAEYSSYLNALVLANDGSKDIIIIDLENSQQKLITFDNVVEKVTLNSNGTQAVIGFEKNIVLVDLIQAKILQQYPISTDIHDLILTDTHVYIFPLTDQWVKVGVLELATGIEYEHSGGSLIYDESTAALHPSGNFVYGLRNRDTLAVFDIRSGIAEYIKQVKLKSRSNFDCDKIWFGNDGEYLLDKCGVLYLSSPLTDDDMFIVDELNLPARINQIDFYQDQLAISHKPKNVNVGVDEPGGVVKLYHYPSLTFNGTIALPKYVRDGVAYPYNALTHYYQNNGNIVVLVKAEIPIANEDPHARIEYEAIHALYLLKREFLEE